MCALKRLRDCGLVVIAFSAWSLTAGAQERVIEDIRITSDGAQALIVIEFACEMRFVADTEISGGALLEVRVAPFDTCLQRGIGSSIIGESYRPIGAEAVHLVEVEYDSLGLGDSVVLLTFDRPVRYTVTQRPTLREVEIAVDISDAEAAATASEAGRRPLSVRVVEPVSRQDYMINLQSTRDPVDVEIFESISLDADRKLYVSQTRIDGVLWHRLRVGFFSSEAEAKAMLEPLSAAFPRAWIGRAEPAEISLASESQAQAGDRRVVTLTSDQLEVSAPVAVAAAEDLTPDQIDQMMGSARSSLVDGDNQAAIEAYRPLAQTSGEHRPEAIEFLGLAYERNGQTARARSEYERYLREFPDGPNRARVDQRLSSVAAAGDAPRESLRDARVSTDQPWDFAAGVSQYYRRDINQFDEDQPSATTQSALLTDIDFSSTRSGENIDILARVSLSSAW